ncbi:MAG: DUF4124 domain-containing protein [Methylophilaceae bacterium]|nr:MAG: DUF4124 domain-containing protein [Methylophilaceae bacterium]
MKIKSSILLAIFSGACYAQPQLYKHVDKDGKTSYSNAPLKDAKKLDLPPLTVIPAIKPKAKIKPMGLSDIADNEARRMIIEEKIAGEVILLEEIKKEYNKGEPDRLGSERNYQRYLDRVQQLKDGMAFHEENIRVLRVELQGRGSNQR